MAAKDPYKVLAVPKGAKDDEVKKAYRKLARQWHPDQNAGNKDAEEKFKDIQEAYAILSDPAQRKAYDSGGFSNLFGGAGGNGPFAGGARNVRFEDLGDILGGMGGLGNMFGGGGRRRPRAERGSDLETEVSIGFDQSIGGTQTSVSVPRRESCTTCSGGGAAPGTTPKTCPRCEGRGVEQLGQGMFSISQPCSQCSGAGQIIEKPCPTCRGSGQVQKLRKFRVNIPAGVRDGTRIRLAGKGEPGVAGGPPGDLFVVTRVAPSPVWARKGENLEVTVPVLVSEALLGATIEVPTLEGTKQVKVAPGTKHGTIIRLAGEGPRKPKGGGRGDLRYRVEIEIPKELSDEQREAAKDLASLFTEDPRAALLAKAGVRAADEEKTEPAGAAQE